MIVLVMMMVIDDDGDAGVRPALGWAGLVGWLAGWLAGGLAGWGDGPLAARFF